MQVTYWPVPEVATLHLEEFSAIKVTRPLSSSAHVLTPLLQDHMLLCPPHKGECEGHTGAALPHAKSTRGPATAAIVFRPVVTSSLACRHVTRGQSGVSLLSSQYQERSSGLQ